MPTNISDDENASFNTLIPQVDENANIQTAFRLYHYGEGDAAPINPSSSSIAGYLRALNEDKLNSVAAIIPGNANLDEYVESGFYAQDSRAKALSGLNYPEIPENSDLRYGGLLRVISDGTNIYQEYHVADLATNPVYWRALYSTFGGQWTKWQTFAFLGHIHDDRYYSKLQSDSIYLPAIKYKSVKQPSLTSNQYTLTKADEDAILLINSGSFPNRVVIPQVTGNINTDITVGTRITLIQSNAGQVEVVGNTANVIVQATPSAKLREIWSAATLTHIGTNNWVLSGDLQDSRTNLQQKASIGIYVQPNQPVGNLQNGDLWFW
jgi:hypothetical protein